MSCPFQVYFATARKHAGSTKTINDMVGLISFEKGEKRLVYRGVWLSGCLFEKTGKRIGIRERVVVYRPHSPSHWPNEMVGGLVDHGQ